MNETFLKQKLSEAYFEAREGERNKTAALIFESACEENLHKLYQELIGRTWKPSPPYCFIIQEPTIREIYAPNFRDRIVSHLLFNLIMPTLERTFIYDSYSCRIGKGVLHGISRTRHFIEGVSKNYSREAWCLSLDISGYFMSIYRPKLKEFLQHDLEKHGYKDNVDIDFCMWIISELLDRDPKKGAKILYTSEQFSLLPPNKSLKTAPLDTGLPIGDLTSQLFSNVYLGRFDNYAKRVLKSKYYGRYVDDARIFSADKSRLYDMVGEIETYLKEELHLNLNRNKTKIQEVHKGIKFLGAEIRYGKIVNHRIIKLIQSEKNLESTLGLASWYNCIPTIEKLNLNEKEYEINLY